MTEREILVNDLLQRLSSDGFDSKQLNIVKQNFYIVLDRYEIKEKRQTTELANVDELNNIIGLYCMSKKIEGVKEGSIKQYIRTVKLFFDYTHKDIHNVTSDDVRLWLNSLQKTNSNTSINNQRVYLSSFFQWCEDNDYIQKNVIKKIKKVKYTKPLRQPISDIDMEKIRNTNTNLRDKTIFEFFYSTGCRVSELTNVKISDIDFDKKEVVVFGKGEKYRKTYLNAKTLVLLNKYLNTRKDNCPYLFVSKFKNNKHQLKYETIENIIRQIGKNAEIRENIYPHKIRHTMATDAIRKGMTIEQVSKILGHESLETTQIYAKVNDFDVKSNYSKYLN